MNTSTVYEYTIYLEKPGTGVWAGLTVRRTALILAQNDDEALSEANVLCSQDETPHIVGRRETREDRRR